jgi:selenocysteine lyase/cysteine desulfurase
VPAFVNLAPAGVRVRFVTPGTGRHVSAADYIAAFTPQTRAVAVSLVAFATGYRIDLDALGEAWPRARVFLVVDGAQAIGGIGLPGGRPSGRRPRRPAATSGSSGRTAPG